MSLRLILLASGLAILSTLTCADDLLASEHMIVRPPPYVPDTKLATRPIIVVAKWEGAKFVNESRVEGNVLKEHQVKTKINIERVLVGDIAPGEHDVLIGFRIGWMEDDPQIRSFMSTEMVGDAKATESNLWILSSQKSINQEDDKDYLFLDTYRGVQPTELEDYFLALRDDDPSQHIAKLLKSKSSQTKYRTLTYVCGEEFPPQEFHDKSAFPPIARSTEKRSRKPLKDHIDLIEALIQDNDQEVREMAAWAYNDLTAQQSIPKMIQLLDGKQLDVRCVAVSALLQHRHWEQAEKISKVAGSLKSWTGCQLISQLSEIKDDRAIPVLIGMLETLGSADGYWTHGIPAVQAQKVLKKRTGMRFPLSVERSQKVWKKYQAATNDQERDEIQHLLESSRPVAFLKGDPSKPIVEVTNVGQTAVRLSNVPSEISIVTPSSHHGGTSLVKGKMEQAILLEPGESLEFGIVLDDGFFTHDPDDRKITLGFTPGKRPLNEENWAGEIDVKVGKDWNEPNANVKQVVERWANGNLKVKGETTNGLKTGKWQYFNEAGDLEKTIEGGSTSVHNPNHPSNKGLGKQ